MTVEQTVDTLSNVLKYMRELIEKIFEAETKYKVLGRIGDYLVYELPGGAYAAVDITDNVVPEARYTRITNTPAFKDVSELKIYVSNLMIDKYILMKRDLEREAGKREYGTPYL
ncbi:MAG TPA: hypothetical protein VMC61_06690 [Methanocella sp.]|nr:hypothetical protein [Methanocella sp.]